MEYNTIHSLGSRCQNSLILKENNLREFSGLFDFLNVEKVSITLHMLEDEFQEFLKEENLITYDFNRLTFDPETNNPLHQSIRTSNKFYQPDNYHDSNYAICPHYDLTNEKERSHFFRCIERFKNLKKYNVLFNYTYNSWENEVTTETMEKIVNVLKNKYGFENFKVCFISLSFSNTPGSEKLVDSEFYDSWSLKINHGSFTGGLFSNSIDNQNFINIINQYKISDNRITKNQIDQE